MDTVTVFELRGPIAHYRRPDTLGTHATYPFLPRTALRGLVGAILGLEDLPAEALWLAVAYGRGNRRPGAKPARQKMDRYRPERVFPPADFGGVGRQPALPRLLRWAPL